MVNVCWENQSDLGMKSQHGQNQTQLRHNEDVEMRSKITKLYIYIYIYVYVYICA